MKIVVHRHIRNLAKASTIVLYEAIPVWSGLSKYIIYKSNVEGAAGTRVADKAIVRSPAIT